MQSKGREAVYFSCPFRPAWGRKGYNKQCCKNARRMRWTSRDNANARRMRRPPRGGEQHALSASPRNGDAKGHCTSMRRSTQENRFHTISAQQLPTFARADTAPAKETARARYRTSAEQRSALPLKGAALSTNNKPRTKGLPWWNLLANLTVMPLRQPTSKRILPNIQGSWFGFSWACPS